jgi:hypothetical protein
MATANAGTTAKANTGVLRFAQNDDILVNYDLLGDHGFS